MLLDSWYPALIALIQFHIYPYYTCRSCESISHCVWVGSSDVPVGVRDIRKLRKPLFPFCVCCQCAPKNDCFLILAFQDCVIYGCQYILNVDLSHDFNKGSRSVLLLQRINLQNNDYYPFC